MSNVKKSFAGGASVTALSGDVTGASATFTVEDGSSYPTGIDGPFVVALDWGQSTEEKVLCSARTGNVFDVAQRGYDGSTALAHARPARVMHVLDAVTVRQANQMANVAPGVKGAVAVSKADGTWLAAAAPTDRLYVPLVSDPDSPSGVRWGNPTSLFGSFRKVSTQAISPGVQTPVTWPSEDFDRSTAHAAGSADYVMNVPGLYFALYQLYVAAATETSSLLYAGMQYESDPSLSGIAMSTQNNIAQVLSGSAIFLAPSGTERIRLLVQNDSVGGSRNIGSAEPRFTSRLQVYFLGGLRS